MSIYRDYLEVHPEEFTRLFDSLLLNVTGFFRDDLTRAYLAGEIIPKILAAKPADGLVRVWCSGRASGEAACTLAILLAESLGAEQFCQRVRIYATDTDEESFHQARQVGYTPQEVQTLPAGWRDQYFELAANRYLLRADLRHSLIFARHDLLQDAPIARLDLLVCRHTLIYFNAEAQSEILTRFKFALADSGFLLLGKAELLPTHAHLFQPLDPEHHLFTTTPGVGPANLGRAFIRTRNKSLTPYQKVPAQRQDFSQELQKTQEQIGLAHTALEMTQQELPATSEELRATNEKLETINTELRPQNEGLVAAQQTLEAERQRAEAEIKHRNEELDRRVAERTAELEAANTELKNEIVERKRMETALRQMSVIEERHRIGLNLHDGVIQSIYAVGLTLDYINDLLAKGDTSGAGEGLKNVSQALNGVIHDIRAYILDLRPLRFEGDNLISGLKQLLLEFKANTRITVEFMADPAADRVLAPEARLALFHIAQEALGNAARHSPASRLEIRLADSENEVTLVAQR